MRLPYLYIRRLGYPARLYREGQWFYRGERWPDANAYNYYRWPLQYLGVFLAWWRHHRWDTHRVLLWAGILRLEEAGFYRDARWWFR